MAEWVGADRCGVTYQKNMSASVPLDPKRYTQVANQTWSRTPCSGPLPR